MLLILYLHPPSRFKIDNMTRLSKFMNKKKLIEITHDIHAFYKSIAVLPTMDMIETINIQFELKLEKKPVASVCRVPFAVYRNSP